MSQNSRPTRLRNEENRLLEISWDDDAVTSVSYHDLRAQCPCAECVNEMTGERVLDVSNIPEGIHPMSVSFVGQYAIRINWSDGHNTGIYTFPRLREISR